MQNIRSHNRTWRSLLGTSTGIMGNTLLSSYRGGNIIDTGLPANADTVTRCNEVRQALFALAYCIWVPFCRA
ncbi:MAG: hypothetical protein KAG66_18630, partial [Methylococcales bacterium]|nr:hypothetical protein [Methylococcales bacterium]